MITEEEFKSILDEISGTSKDKLVKDGDDKVSSEISLQELYRKKALELFEIQIPAGDTPKRFM